MLRIPYPVTDSQRRQAREAIAGGLAVGIGLAVLYPDLDLDVIWGVDPYGEDTLAANETDAPAIESSIDWAEKVHEREHLAERSYDF
ncbi:hypothetical protein [Xanthomonas vesicatoria]|uniref:hypothetical protein n=1 Tax=Xanthomonas vesicatoria TaxID=56460 RepID=UPI0009525C96|nr:hypothetical protein [Xanthomonas vesicatoria]MBD5034969.1 hypothetical protein [Xanthomonas citri pv. citri]MBD5054747.1 hypothetical protein [Xanthomonas citri pv. citri]MCC8630247.1 hypothetical protein [Xanthomonas vesicatoria]OLR69704.1 hypothetical protein BI311_23600 [Xanthomonas citri pv. citri]